MVLTVEQIKSITCGAVRIEEADGWYRFHRMTALQEQYYLEEKPHFYAKALASAGIRLSFRTDSQRLSFRFHSAPGSSRTFGWFDLYPDGAMTQHFGFEGAEMTEGRFELALGEGEKHVELYLPWSRQTALSDVTLEDGASLLPIRRSRTMLCFGDSITQGFDTLYPSQSYVSRLARMLDADEFNKGVGGEKFCPHLLREPDAIDPDIVTVAYGANDWSKLTRDEFCANCRAFLERVSAFYPHSKIFVISPIWSIDCEKTYAYGAPLREVHAAIEECCHGFSNLIPINGFSLVPHMKEFFKDMRAHPNDIGFSHYAEGLCREIMKHL